MLNNKTQICCIIGYPIKHSLSPEMHNAAFKKLKLNYTYLALPVPAAELKSTLQGLKALNIKGINVTIPHKIEALKYLDKINPLALEIGAVNTIVNNSNTLTGYNTDGNGAVDALAHSHVTLREKNVVILGAGGSSRAISFTLLKEKISSLTILNRTLSNANSLAKELSKKTSIEIHSAKLDNSNLKKSLANADICINTTSIGMLPNVHFSPIPKALLKKDLTVFDIVYNPHLTKLLNEAKKKHCKIITGELMLAYQGARAFELFTGTKAPVETMVKALRKKLK